MDAESARCSHPAEKPTGWRGTTRASWHSDELDRMLLGFILSRRNDMPRVIVLDVGCGNGERSARMARAGASVVAIDHHDYSESLTSAMLHEGTCGRTRGGCIWRSCSTCSTGKS
jgi:2-polyprenyl-3-methyl-5-hydroxy-6-metoxy-1,4-benzoquinol methylase